MLNPSESRFIADELATMVEESVILKERLLQLSCRLSEFANALQISLAVDDSVNLSKRIAPARLQSLSVRGINATATS